MSAGHEDRLRAVENAMIELRGDQEKHEAICATRYEQIHKDIKYGMARLTYAIKCLAWAVAALALLVTGITTARELIASASGRIGIQVQAAPSPR